MTYCLYFRARAFQIQEKKNWLLNQSATSLIFPFVPSVVGRKIKPTMSRNKPPTSVESAYGPRILSAAWWLSIWHDQPYILFCFPLVSAIKNVATSKGQPTSADQLPTKNQRLPTGRYSYGWSEWKRLGSGLASYRANECHRSLNEHDILNRCSVWWPVLTGMFNAWLGQDLVSPNSSGYSVCDGPC